MVHSITIAQKGFSFKTAPGVFAQYGLDEGSRVLLENIPAVKDKSIILDLGCGCGFIGIVIAKLFPDCSVYMVDSDIRAVRLSKKNAELNKVDNVHILLSDGVFDIHKDISFDLVLSNPPTHQGREVVVQFIKGAHRVLRKRGRAYFVVNRMGSVLKKMDSIFARTKKLCSKKGYRVYEGMK